jgi:hypothetical protein
VQFHTHLESAGLDEQTVVELINRQSAFRLRLVRS